MGRSGRNGLLVIALFVCAAGPVAAQTKAKAENVPVIPHTSVPNFFKLPPDLYFGEGIGIASHGRGLLRRLRRHGCGSDGLSLRDVAAAGGHEHDEEPRRQSFHALMM